MSDYSYHLALLYTERNVFQHRVISLVAEIYVLKLDISLYIKAYRVFGIIDIVILFEYLKYLACASTLGRLVSHWIGPYSIAT